MCIQKVRVDGLKLSRLCLGGGKMENMPLNEGRTLVYHAMNLGINIFDAHHRYGNCEDILGSVNNIPPLMKMAKISAYLAEDMEALLQRSTLRMKNDIEIYWVSDLDDCDLYEKGRRIYEQLRDNDVQIYHRNTLFRGRVGRLGITTESPVMAWRFLEQYPECMFYMIPFYMGKGDEMARFARQVKKQGKYLFVIKPFDDGRLLENSHITTCLKYIDAEIKPDVICFGTKSIQHLEETVRVFKELTENILCR